MNFQTSLHAKSGAKKIIPRLSPELKKIVLTKSIELWGSDCKSWKNQNLSPSNIGPLPFKHCIYNTTNLPSCHNIIGLFGMMEKGQLKFTSQPDYLIYRNDTWKVMYTFSKQSLHVLAYIAQNVLLWDGKQCKPEWVAISASLKIAATFLSFASLHWGHFCVVVFYTTSSVVLKNHLTPP